MRKVMMLTAGCGMLLASVAWAQRAEPEGPQVGDYAPAVEAREWLNVVDRSEVPSLSELRGLIVVVFFWSSWQEGGDQLLPYVNALSYNEYGQTPDVYFIGVTDANRGTTQPVIADAKVFFPVGVESKSAAEYGFEAGFNFVVVDPEGKIAFKSQEGRGRGVDLNSVVNAVGDIRKNNPPTRTHPAEARACYRLLDEACQLVDQGRYPAAYRKARDVFLRSVLGDPLHSRTMELGDLLEELGYDRLAAFGPLEEAGKYDQAAEVLRDVIRRFRGMDCGLEAKATYERLVKEDEDFKKAAGEFDDEDSAARLYLEARDLLKARRFGESYDALNKVLTEYPATQAAEYAEAMVDRMKANPAFWAQIRDHVAEGECKTLLARARVLIGQGRQPEAEKLLRRIADEYPHTTWAEEAIKELKALPDTYRFWRP